MVPDDNSPTVPNAPVSPPNAPGGGGPPPPPRSIDDRGRPPIWQVMHPQTGAGAGAGGISLGGFGVGVAIALAVLAIMVVGLILLLNVHTNKGSGLGQVPTTTPVPTPTQNALVPTATPLPPVTSKSATDLSTLFYSYINSRDYQNAYNLLGSNLQRGQSSAAFAAQWQNVQSLTVDPSSITASAGNNGTEIVKLNYTQLNNDGSSIVTQATLQVGYDQNNLRILALNTLPLGTPTPVTQPTATPAPQPTDTPAPQPTSTPAAGTPTPPAGSPTPGP
jgi:hypothetical protein